jgi:5'(3')-deoxyribonucleotidase
MNDKIVAVDIDEVLSETMKYILNKYKNEINGQTVKFEDLTDYNVWDISKL